MSEATAFDREENSHNEPTLYGVDNGKTIGTYIENKFVIALNRRFKFKEGNAASGIDIPGLNVDIKTTTDANGKPQSSCPFTSARQKVYGLGYHLLLFVYRKTEDHEARTAKLNLGRVVFVDKTRTADFQTTTGLRRMLDSNANEDDIVGFLLERNLPVDEISAAVLAQEILSNPPPDGYLTISNAQQWRLAYGRVIASSGLVSGIEQLF